MQAVILAGGKGTRLEPYTTILPKPLMPVGDIPILEIILRQLKYYGFHKIILALGHKAKFITTFFENGTDLGLDITYSYEKEDLGTAGPLTLIKNLEENFIVMNGDILTDMDYNNLFQTHVSKKALITVASYSKTMKIDLGVMKTEGNRIVSYTEKPTMTYQVSMGIYVFNRHVVDFIPQNKHFDFPDLINKLLSTGEYVHVFKPKNSIWLDIGRLEDFKLSVEVFEKNKSRFLP
ncbi:MAG: sugar phosphate nucleotidyltransferase [Promethearchaeota archaeon]